MIRIAATALLFPLLAWGALASASIAQTPPAMTDAEAADRVNKALDRFDPRVNHFVWALPPGIVANGPWTLKIELSREGVVQLTETVALKAEVIDKNHPLKMPNGYQGIRLSDAGEWQAKIPAVKKAAMDQTRKFGQGGNGIVVNSGLVFTLDDAGRQAYCVDKKPLDIRLFFEESAIKKISTMSKPGDQPFNQRLQAECAKKP